MRIHLVSLPHTQVTPAFSGCAYTSKVLKFSKMMGAKYPIYLYSPQGPKVDGVTMHLHSLADFERTEIFGKDDRARLPDWPTDEQTKLFNDNTIEFLKETLEPHDLILLSGGRTHMAIADAFPQHIVAEPGVGYEGIYAKYCAFESYAHMHHVYAKAGINDGRYFDRVIPNYFDPEDFPFLNQGDGEYLLFLGRLISRKGPHIAAEIAKACKMPLWVAGAGAKTVSEGLIIANDGTRLDGDVHYMGPVGRHDRAKLLAGAKALLVPTTYIEPFGGVAVEAMMAGTPVIAPDFGAFVETVEPGVSGFRFHMLRDAVAAVTLCEDLEPSEIRAYARKHYSLTSVSHKFDEWFSALGSLWGRGWYDGLQIP